MIFEISKIIKYIYIYKDYIIVNLGENQIMISYDLETDMSKI